MERDQIDNAGMILLFDSHESFCDGIADLTDLKINDLPVSLCNLVHNKTPSYGTVIFIDDCRELSGICLLRTQLQYHEGILSSISSGKLN